MAEFDALVSCFVEKQRNGFHHFMSIWLLGKRGGNHWLTFMAWFHVLCESTQWLSCQRKNSAPALRELWRLTSGPPSTTFPALLVEVEVITGILCFSKRDNCQHWRNQHGSVSVTVEKQGNAISFAHSNASSPFQKATGIEVQSLLKGTS